MLALRSRSEAMSWASRLFLKSSMSSSLDTEPRRSLPERKLRKVEGRREMRFCSWPLRVDRAFGSVFRGRKPLELARRERLVDRGRLLLAGEGELPGVMGGGSRNGMVRVTMRARVKVKVKVESEDEDNGQLRSGKTRRGHRDAQKF